MPRSSKKSKKQTVSIPEATLNLSRIVREGLFIITLALSIFLLLAFATFHGTDPSWSTTGTSKHIANIGGRAGAMLSDIFLYLFGYTAFLLPFMMAFGAWLGFYGRKNGDSFHVGLFLLRTLGFVFILLSTTGIESLWFAKHSTHLPFTAGGILGNFVGLGLNTYFNPFGASLLMIGFFLLGVTLFTGMSWWTVLKLSVYYAYQASIWLYDMFGNFIFWTREKIAEARAQKMTMPKPAQKRPPSFYQQPPVERPVEKVEPRFTSAFKKTEVTKPKKTAKTPKKMNPNTGLPGFDLLDVSEETSRRGGYSAAILEQMSRDVEARLKDFGVTVEVVDVHPGPVITRFEMSLAPGVKVSRITGLGKDLARSLSVMSVRVVEVIPGKNVVGLEVPNAKREMVRLREVLESKRYHEAQSPLSLALGHDIAGHPVVVDLAKMPHLLAAGTTGSGKSVSLNAMLLSILYKATPDQVRFIMIDPKMLELSIYEGIPHLLTPVVTDMKEAANALRWCVAEMDKRYRLMAHMGVRSLAAYNKKIAHAAEKNSPIPAPPWNNPDGNTVLENLPFIVVIIDEFADMMMVVGKKVEELIARIAQKARAAGIHLILATQRPSVDVITGLIKANVPTRIAFQVSSRIDSRTILDQQGAEQLLGHGDMLYLPPGSGVPVRVHGAFVADDEVHQVVADWKARAEPEYLEEILQDNTGDVREDGGDGGEQDALYDQAVAIVTESRRASISYVQRRLKIGYNRSARLIEEMEAAGVVSGVERGAREVLAPPPIKD